MAVRAPRSREATTIYRTLETFPGATLVEIDLVTGRTHQIRVHFASRKHPVIGDTRYGGAPWKLLRDPERRVLFAALSRLALHATRLEFTHPVTKAPMSFSAPLPDDLAALVDALRSAP
jgi:23S rRNA pseudouridine1911/1915/1917 synthase